MTSSYTVNNGLEKPEAGDQEGTWGGTLNTNFDIIDRVLSGVGSISLSGTTHTLTTTDGTLTDGMYRVLLFTGALGANNTVTISPNDQDKLYFVVNNTTDSGSSGPYSVIIKQGTGATVTVANGAFNIVYADGAGSGAAVVSLLSKDVVFGDDVSLQSDGAVLNFGADDDTKLTHTDGTGLTLNSTNKLTFGDTASFVQQSSDGVLKIDGEATIDMNASTAVTVSNDLKLDSDAAVLGFGTDNDVTLTHVADTGLLLNSTMQLQFNDASQNITAPNATTLDINATDEVEINATLADVNANLEVSGTYTGGGTMTTGGNIVIPDAGNIGSASDTDAISISSGGAVTFSQTPVFPDGSIAIADLDIDGGTDVGEALVDADLFIVDNGAGGTNRKSALSRLKTYLGSPDKTLTTYKYTATAGQTTFTGSDDASATLAYTTGNLLVILNGLTLINGTDYTASNGTSVVLTNAATVGDELIIHAFSNVNLSTQTLTLFKYSATAGQTTFTGSDSASQTLAYTVGMIIVTLNGVVLDTSDYTASNGTSVVLDSDAAATVGDELNIIAFTAFNVANVTTASADFAIGDDLSFTSDGAIINMGADSDVTITHVADTGIKLNSTLHLEKSDATTYDATNSAGQVTVGPTIYLENPANANDTVGGQIVFGMRSTEEQARIGATGGTTPVLVFGTADVERMRISDEVDITGALTATGNIFADGGMLKAEGTGTTSGTALLTTDSAGTYCTRVLNSGSLITGTKASSPVNHTTSAAANTFVSASGYIRKSTSSLRYKKDVQDLDPLWADKVLDFKPIFFKSDCPKIEGDSHEPDEWTYYGFAAEQVGTIDPRYVFWNREKVEWSDEGRKSTSLIDSDNPHGQAEGVQYDRITVALVDIIKRQKTAIDSLTKRIEALEAK
jgi:hypothetical protein